MERPTIAGLSASLRDGSSTSRALTEECLGRIERGDGPYRFRRGALFFGTDGTRRGLFATDGTETGTSFVDPVLVGGVNPLLNIGVWATLYHPGFMRTAAKVDHTPYLLWPASFDTFEMV